MRATLILVFLLAFTPAALAAAPSAGGPYYRVTPTLPGDGCGKCVGVSVVAGVAPPPNCADCASLGAGVAVLHDGADTHVDAAVCRGGFFYFCLVDEHVVL